MGFHTDTHNYTLNGASSPWRTSQGAPSISGGEILLTCDDAIGRMGGADFVGNYVLDCDVTVDATWSATGQAGVGIGLRTNGGPFYDLNYRFAGLKIHRNLGESRLCGVDLLSWVVQNFGAFTQNAIPVHASSHACHYRWVVQPASQRVALLLTVGGTTYNSGWVTWTPTGVNNYGQPWFYCNNNGSTSNVFGRIGTISVQDEIPDVYVEQLVSTGILPIFGSGAPSIGSVTAAGAGMSNPRGSGALVVPSLLAAGVGVRTPIRPPSSRIGTYSTVKPSHARILRGERTPNEAAIFHDVMKGRRR